jgi:ADP-ribose pyrophosphatase YjhB (NUDIX family)
MSASPSSEGDIDDVAQLRIHVSAPSPSTVASIVDEQAAGAFHGAKESLRRLEVRDDRFRGKIVEVHAVTESPDDVAWFQERVVQLMKEWRGIPGAVRGVWFHLPPGSLTSAGWLRSTFGFRLHHASEAEVVLNLWLPKEEDPNKMPPYAHTYCGVGSVVLRVRPGETEVSGRSLEVLTVIERWAFDTVERPKLPGGFVDPNERLWEAAEREVWEEVGIRVNFLRVVGMKHSTTFAPGCSDMYFACLCVPCAGSTEIRVDPTEIAAASWMSITEFLTHPDVFPMNKELVRSAVADFLIDPERDPAPRRRQSSVTSLDSPASPKGPEPSDGYGWIAHPKCVKLPGAGKRPYRYDLYAPFHLLHGAPVIHEVSSEWAVAALVGVVAGVGVGFVLGRIIG